MEIKDAVVFVTGANRGLGFEFARQALRRGAKKVYAAARNPESITLPGVIPVKLDVTKPEDAARAAQLCGDVTLVINNAGIGRVGGALSPDTTALLREQLETNLFGVVNVSRAFAGILGRNGGGALLNVLSILSWINNPTLGAYSVSKAAAWSYTNGLRLELRGQGTQVLGLHAGLIDTDLVRDFDKPKTAPEDVVRQAYEAIEGGQEEVRVDEGTREVKKGLSNGVYLVEIAAV
jgi:NAD(P)-dependent dehydrogenase (short-subunit alcohol dehydrogenase family)